MFDDYLFPAVSVYMQQIRAADMSVALEIHENGKAMAAYCTSS
jgi:hypothetical protein